MTALYIILGILLAFFLLSLLRLGVRVEFTGSLAETRVTVIAGPARIQLLPKPEKPEKPQKEKKKKEKPAKAKAEGGEKKKLHLTKEDIKKRTIEMLETVGIANSNGVYEMYPHELSGGC